MIRIRRVHYIGEPSMPLSDVYPDCVTFIGRWATTDAGPLEEAIDGTGFLVGISGRDESQKHIYVVTAAHVVSQAQRSFVRIRDNWQDDIQKIVDMHVPEWYVNPDPSKDVAIAPIALPQDHAMSWTTIEDFIDDPSWKEDDWLREGGPELMLGDIVYFIGLLGKIEAMTEASVPIVRSGTIARLWQERCPVWVPQEDTTRYITAHLIDCRSFGGFSGSPCYFQQSRAGYVAQRSHGLPGEGGITTKYWTGLLGMIGGHFDDWRELDKNPHLRTPVNTGVGYVIPAEHIRETLNMKELKDMREAADAEKQARVEPGATMDTAAQDETEYDRFEDLTKRLVQVPKPELEARKEGNPK